jgi:hypothetical protein
MPLCSSRLTTGFLVSLSCQGISLTDTATAI